MFSFNSFNTYLLPLLVFCGCNGLQRPTTTTSLTNEAPRDQCQNREEDNCAERQCIYNSFKKLCENKLLGHECRDLSASEFQCVEAAIGLAAPFGCIYKDNSCSAAKACSELITAKQCDRAKDKNCRFLDGMCQENVPMNVYALLAHPNAQLQKRFHEAFSAFGAFLIYYQKLAKNLDKAGIEQAMGKALASICYRAIEPIKLG